MSHAPRRARCSPCVRAALVAAFLAASAAGADTASCKPLPPVSLEIVAGDAVPGAGLPFEIRIHADRPVDDLRLEVVMPAARGPRRSAEALAQHLDAKGNLTRRMTATLPAKGVSEILARVEFRLPGGGRLSRAAYLQFEDGRAATHAPARIARSGPDPVAEYRAGGVR